MYRDGIAYHMILKIIRFTSTKNTCSIHKWRQSYLWMWSPQIFTGHTFPAEYHVDLTYLCDFETSYCDMLQSVSDTREWRRHREPPKTTTATYSAYSSTSGAKEDHTTGTINGK